MKIRHAFLSAALLCASLPATGPASAGISPQPIIYRDGEDLFEGYIVYDDENENKRPGVLVVHEWKGLNNYAKKRANQLAEEGYVAFALDMYGKEVRPKTSEAAAKESAKYKKDRLLMRKRAEAALTIFRQHPLVDPDRVAAIGYCFGGTVVLEMARGGAPLNGVVSFHGGLATTNPARPGDVKAKVLVLHGDADPHAPPAEVETFRKEMKDAGIDADIVMYPGAAHGFTNPDNGSDPTTGVAYDADADAQSWEKMRAFFDEIFAL